MHCRAVSLNGTENAWRHASPRQLWLTLLGMNLLIRCHLSKHALSNRARGRIADHSALPVGADSMASAEMMHYIASSEQRQISSDS